MRKVLTAGVTALAITAGGATVPASALTVEHVGADCRINATIEEQNTFNTLYFTPAEVTKYQQLIAEQIQDMEKDLANRPDGDNQPDKYLEANRALLAALNECAAGPVKEPVEPASPASSANGSSAGALGAGIVGGIIGAAAALATTVDLRQFLPAGF